MPRRRKKTNRVGGIEVRSAFEAAVIEAALEHADPLPYEPWSIEYTTKPKKYTPDLELPNGIVVEIKGRLTTFDRQKHLAIKEQHPELDLRFVFQYDNFLFKGAKSRYSDWCKKYGFKYAFGTIPEEWFEED